MFCKNCGAQLMGTENVCPNCGVPVESNNPAVAPNPVPVQGQVPPVTAGQPEIGGYPSQPGTPIVEPVPQQPVQAVPLPQTVSEPMPQTMVTQAPQGVPQEVVPQAGSTVPQAVPNPVSSPSQAPQGATSQNPKKNSTTFILIIILLIVALVGVVLYFVLFKNAETNNSSNNNTQEENEISEAIENNVSYGGYTFTLPDSYTAERTEDYGLIISNDNIAYSIMIDYSNNYEAYKYALTLEYPDQASQLEVIIGGRSFLGLVLTKTTGEASTEYVTAASDTGSFIGLIVKSDYSVPTMNDLTDLTDIINSAVNTSSFAAGNSDDAGKDGIRIFDIETNGLPR